MHHYQMLYQNRAVQEQPYILTCALQDTNLEISKTQDRANNSHQVAARKGTQEDRAAAKMEASGFAEGWSTKGGKGVLDSNAPAKGTEIRGMARAERGFRADGGGRAGEER